jgi:hypothetical protein
MDRCETCQPQLLDYLYDLLDGDDRRALEGHLAGCAACQAALERARRGKALLAAAAKLAFPDVRFAAPPEAPAAAPAAERDVLPLPPAVRARPRARRRLLWAAAAAVLLGLGVPALWVGYDYAAASRTRAEHERALAELRAARAGLDRQSRRPEPPWAPLRERARPEPQGLAVRVTGPAAVAPGAPAEYRVDTTDLKGRPVPAEVTAQVVDAAGARRGEPVAAKTADDGTVRVSLPPGLTAAAGGAVRLVFRAQDKGGARADVEEALGRAAPAFVTHLATDKPVYRPGEVVRFRSLTLDRATLRPAGEDFRLVYTLTVPAGGHDDVLSGNTGQLAQADGKPFVGADGKPVRGIGVGEYPIGPGAAPGDYTLTVRDEQSRFAPQERTFRVRGPAEPQDRPAPRAPEGLEVDFFPEGGDLVAGAPNRVYFEARTTTGDPAAVKGRLLAAGKAVGVTAEAAGDGPAAAHGLGQFTFTPQAEQPYQFEVGLPGGAVKQFPLPPVRTGGVVLSVPDGVTGPGQPIRVRVGNPSGRPLMVAATCRGRLLDTARLADDRAEAELHPDAGAGGVVRVTAYEDRSAGAGPQELRPVAERLVYRRPAERLDVVLTPKPEQAAFSPGQAARLGIEARDEKGQMAPALALVAVVDRRDAPAAEVAPSLPAYVLLTSGLRRPEDLEDADVLLGTDPRAAAALDLVLGTRGWRRFDEAPAGGPGGPRPGDDGRLLVAVGRSPELAGGPPVGPGEGEADGDDRRAALGDRLREADRQLVEAAAEPAYVEAVAKLARYDRALDRARRVGVPVLTGLLGLAALACLALGLVRLSRRSVPHLVTALACGIMAVLLFRSGLGGERVGPERQMAEGVPQGAAPAPRPEAGDAKVERAARDADLARVEPRPQAAEAKSEPRVATPPPPAATEAPPANRATPAAPAPEPPATAPSPPAPPGGAALGGGRGPTPTPPAAADRAEGGRLRGGANTLDTQRDGAAGRRFAAARREAAPQEAGADKKDAGRDRELAAKGKDAGRIAPAAAPGARAAAAVPRPAMRPLRVVKGPEEGEAKAAGEGTGGGGPMVVRQYARPRSAAPEAGTVFWHPVLPLPVGKAQVSFDLPDAAGAYHVTVFAHTPDGRLGAATGTLSAAPAP